MRETKKPASKKFESKKIEARQRLSPMLPALVWVMALAWFFAQIEVQIEGGAGWAANLPTWRIESHWLLDIFWGGRAMTGYHAWVFPFIAMFFHFPLFFWGRWSWQAQCRVLACIMLFWVIEDFLWFVINPEFGLENFNAESVPWHKYWLWLAPVDYWIYLPLAALLLRLSTCSDLNRKKQIPYRPTELLR